MWGGGGLLGRLWQAAVTPIRTIYYAEKIAKGRLIRHYGYRDAQQLRGTLPHIYSREKLPMPDYKPSCQWSWKASMRGQNDYIDILGTPDIHPAKILYNVPAWLRGFRGKQEYNVLLRRRKILLHSEYRLKRPTKWYELEKRIRYLNRFLNRKTKTGPSLQ